jgi:3-phenylpropionate/cinnamic acid dioxygenase small subunit
LRGRSLDDEGVDERIAARIDRLQTKYVRALDQRALQVWLDCFTADGNYVCIHGENVTQGLPLAIMLDDSRERLLDRVKFIEEVWAGTYEEYQTRHFVQRLTCEETGDGLYAITSNVLVAYTAADGRSDILIAGTYEDEVVLADDGPRFRSKRAILDTVSTPRYLVYPI